MGKKRKRQICARCARPESVCWCGALPSSLFPVSLKRVSKVVLLTHPLEIKQQALRTGRMVEVAFGDAVHVFVGRDFRGVTALHKILDGAPSLLMCLQPGSEPLAKVLSQGQGRLHEQEVRSGSTASVVSEQPKGWVLVLLDATWRYARDTLAKNPFLLERAKLVHLANLEPEGPAAAFASCRAPPKLGSKRGRRIIGNSGGGDGGGSNSKGESTDLGEDGNETNLARPVSTYGAAVEALILIEGVDALCSRLGIVIEPEEDGKRKGEGEGEGEGEGVRERVRVREKYRETQLEKLREILHAPLALVAEQQRKFRLAAEERKRVKLDARAREAKGTTRLEREAGSDKREQSDESKVK